MGKLNNAIGTATLAAKESGKSAANAEDSAEAAKVSATAAGESAGFAKRSSVSAETRSREGEAEVSRLTRMAGTAAATATEAADCAARVNGAAHSAASRSAEFADKAEVKARSARVCADNAESQCDRARDAASEALGDAENSRILVGGFLKVVDAVYKIVAGDLSALTELKDSSARQARILRLLTGEFACLERDADTLAREADAADAEAKEAFEFAETLRGVAKAGSTESRLQAEAASQAAHTAAVKAKALRAKANAAYETAAAADKAHDPERDREAAEIISLGGEFEPVPERAEPEPEPSPEPGFDRRGRRIQDPDPTMPSGFSKVPLPCPPALPDYRQDDPKAEGGE